MGGKVSNVKERISMTTKNIHQGIHRDLSLLVMLYFKYKYRYQFIIYKPLTVQYRLYS